MCQNVSKPDSNHTRGALPAMASDDFPEIPQTPQPETQILSPDQLQAINLILAGKSYGEVAEALGKDRRTLYSWRQNPHFLAEMGRRRKEMYEAGQSRLHGLLDKAITVMEHKLDEGNVKVAFEVLRLLNVTTKTIKADYEDNPEAVAAREAEKIAHSAIAATPFANENMAIGAYRNRELRALASDIYEVIKEKYQIPTALEELLDPE